MDFNVNEKVEIIALQNILNKYRTYENTYCQINVISVDNGNYLFKMSDNYVLAVMNNGIITGAKAYATLDELAKKLIATLVEVNMLRSAVCTYDRECKNLSVKTEEEIDEIFNNSFMLEPKCNIINKAKVIA